MIKRRPAPQPPPAWIDARAPRRASQAAECARKFFQALIVLTAPLGSDVTAAGLARGGFVETLSSTNLREVHP